MEEIDIKELGKFILSKISIVIIMTMVFLIGGLIYINFLLTPMYHSSTTLILVSDNKNTENATSVQSDVTLNKNLVATYSQIVKSRSVLNDVKEKLKLGESIETLSSKINVESIENTEIIKIQVSDSDNKKAKLIAEAVADSFKAEVQRIYNLTNVSIVDKAIVEENPYNVNVIKQLSVASGVGLVLGLGIVFLIFYFDTTIKSGETIEEKLDLSVLGRVTEISDKKKKENENNELIVESNPKSSFSESIKTIRTNLQFSLLNKDCKVILLTSSEPGDGKSFISANLATAFTQENKKVLLIDSDLRKGRQHRIFKLKNDRSKGYSNLILANKDEGTIKKYIKQTDIKNLDLLTTGAMPPGPSELLASSNNKELIEKLREMYDIIILDCAPVLGLNDTLVMTKYSDINVVVASKSKTKIETLNAVKNAFIKANVKISGVILNKVKQKDQSYYGYYGK